MAEPNLHATALVVGDRGLLIIGESGAGKSALALAILQSARGAGCFARLLSDDQVMLGERHGRLVASAPQTIAGLFEVYGLGPTPLLHEGAVVIDLVFSLVAASDVPRLQDQRMFERDGVVIPMLLLPEREIARSLPVALARLGIGIFHKASSWS